LHQSLYFRPGEGLEEEGFLSEDVRPTGTYKTLAEQREVLTPAEERFERLRQTTGLFLGPVAFLINRPEVRRISGAEEYIAEERSKLGPFSTGERNTLIAFAVAVTLWVLPGLSAVVFGDESLVYSVLYSRLDEGTVAIIGAALLFILPINWSERRFTMNWNDAAKIDWGTILLFGCGIALGILLADTGLAETLGTGIADAFGFSSLLAVSAVSAIIAILISETTSNTASATIVVPIVIPIASAAGLDPLIPALAAVFGASFGFMMLVSTPQNAVVYGSGMILT
jgi:sodium-dependent dicarboxylate transporter 2/3/5